MNELPATNIMKIGDYKDAVIYRIACDCSDPLHDVNMWIEVVEESDIASVSVSFFVEATARFWSKGFNRFKLAWEVLSTGQYKAEHHFMISQQAAVNMATVMIDQVSKFNNKLQDTPCK